MNDPVILSSCRTPIGKFRGGLASLSAPDLGAIAVQAALKRAGVEPEAVQEVILGNVIAAGVGQAPARQAALKAGIPERVGALTINKVCGSGLKAVMLAAQAIRAGDAELIVAGGMESMSRAPYLIEREGPPIGNRSLVDSMLHDGLVWKESGQVMGEVADAQAAADGITRAEQDRFAFESQHRAAAAIETGAFRGELVPVDVPGRRETVTIERDEGPRPESSLEKLGALKPAFGASGTVTAGNASMISDGAAAVTVASQAFAERHGARPVARVVATATSGVSPEAIFIAPVDAIRTVLDRAGLTLDQIDLIELNEAFAAQMLACLKRLELDPERVNVHGGAIALGHPIGASGARVLTTLLHALERRSGHYGLASLCLGGGNAVAMIVERIA